MGTKLYVGGISYSTSEASLMEAFQQCGSVVSARIIMDRETGRSRGFGFVEMSTPEEAEKAIEFWNGKTLDGRTLKVTEARPQEDRGDRRSFKPRGGSFENGGEDEQW